MSAGFFFSSLRSVQIVCGRQKYYGTNDKLRPFTLKLCLKLKSIGQATLFYQPRNGRQRVRLTSCLCFVFILPEFGLKQQQLTFMHAYTLSHTRAVRKNEQERKQNRERQQKTEIRMCRLYTSAWLFSLHTHRSPRAKWTFCATNKSTEEDGKNTHKEGIEKG